MSVFPQREAFLDQLKTSRIVVVGFGLTGKAVAKSLKNLGLLPSLVDTRSEGDLKEVLDEVKNLGLPTLWGEEAKKTIKDADWIIVSPGVALTDPFLQQARKGAEIISEIELAYRLAPCPIVAITGTNGKSTTTRLTGQILGSGGKNVLVGGNIGDPLIEKALCASSTTLLVAEVSSFQLEGCQFFQPFVGVLLNITNDHLNRHPRFEDYVSLKARLFQRQTPSEVAIGNLDDPLAAGIVDKTASQKFYFSRSPHKKDGVFLEQGRIWWQVGGEREEVCPLEGWKLPGAHNLENLLAATAAGKVCGVENEKIAAAFKEFQPSEHTLEEVGTIHGITYINDSKGTNPAATASALQTFPGKVVLIAGGSDKIMDFEPLLETFREKVRCLIALGETRKTLRRLGERAGLEEISEAPNVPEAVRLASHLGRPGETVLFSPAAASFDMFRDYKERGEVFKKAVKELKK